MSRPLGPAFHAAQVRDALGLVRTLFAVEREGTDITRTAQLTEIGRTLAECLMLTHGRAPDTLGYRAAVHRSREAVDALATLLAPLGTKAARSVAVRACILTGLDVLGKQHGVTP